MQWQLHAQNSHVLFQLWHCPLQGHFASEQVNSFGLLGFSIILPEKPNAMGISCDRKKMESSY